MDILIHVGVWAHPRLLCACLSSVCCVAYGTPSILPTRCPVTGSCVRRAWQQSYKNQLHQASATLSFSFYISSCHDLQMEIALLQEQLSHLQFVIHSQHQTLRSVIQEVRLIKRVSLVDGMFTVRRPNAGSLSGPSKQ